MLTGTQHAEVEISESFRDAISRTLHLIRKDIAFRRIFDARPAGAINDLLLLTNPALRCVISFRLQGLFYGHGLGLLGSLLKYINLIVYGVEIDERARIGGGFVIGHPISIRIGGDVIIGERCVVYHHVTIVSDPFFEPGREPGPCVVGDDVIFAMGSCAQGKIAIGDGCRIGANTLVEKSVPAGASVFGSPAKIRPR
jgi:serine O-acetyltransferase